MQISILDSTPFAQTLSQQCQEFGHSIAIAQNESDLTINASHDNSVVFFINYAETKDIKDCLSQIRRKTKDYPYIVLLHDTMDIPGAIELGANNALPLNADTDSIANCLDTAKGLHSLIQALGDDSIDFPSAGGVIAKSAFNQLFLSALERSERYAETSYLLLIAVENYQDILNLDGNYAADYAVAKLSQALVHLRRQSDVIGQISKSGFALLLQRPSTPTEPEEAAQRFIDSLSNAKDMIPNEVSQVVLNVSLIGCPSGIQSVNTSITPEKD